MLERVEVVTSRQHFIASDIHQFSVFPVSVSTLDFHFQQDLRLEFRKVDSSVLIDDSSRCGYIGHGLY